MKTIALAILLAFTAGCGATSLVPGPQGIQGGPGVDAPASVITAAQADINAIVADENTYREYLGQSYLTPGLSCTLYTITGGQYIQNDVTHTPTLTGVSQVATFLLTAPFSQPDASTATVLNVLPTALQANPHYQNLIKLTCQGQVVVTADGYYAFDLTSDDGSVLYIDGSRLIDADGNHGATTTDGTKLLRRGVHSFRLDFAQTGAGNQALILNVNGTLLDAALFYH